MKRCTKCDDPILTPMLGAQHERCPLCGDEPATPEEILDLLNVASRPLVRLMQYMEGQESGSWEHEVFKALDLALDDIDSAVRTLNEPEEWA